MGTWDDETDSDETGNESIPTVSINGTDMPLDEPWELERIQVSFPAAENGEQTEADEATPLGWCNSAAITLDRGDDAVHLTISVGDPRGAFCLTVRRLPSGELVMHVPYPDGTYMHMPLTALHAGTYRIGH